MNTRESMAIAYAQECLHTVMKDLNYGCEITGDKGRVADFFLEFYDFALQYFERKGY